MKVLYIISTIGQGSGNGGHYYSLRTTVEHVNKKLDCAIIVIGTKESPVINQSKIKVYNLIFEKIDILNLIRIIRDIKNIAHIEEAEIIHTFDEDAFFFGSLISIICKKPYVHTKCGGGNPRIAFPKVNNLILYSRENMNYFQKSKRFNKSNIYYIPNRVGEFYQNISKINKIKSIINTNDKLFLIISRINNDKKNSLLQSINLINKLNADGLKSTLIIIGIIQDVKIYDEIKSNLNESIHIFTDDDYTINASELIDVADFVVGSGRSFMEAASRGKIMLCPVNNSMYPLLITSDNFQEAFDKNFSHRLIINEFDSNENYIKISRTLTDQKYATHISKYIKSASDKYFDMGSKIDTYCEIYQRMEPRYCFNPLDMLVFIYRIIKRNL